jgi:hypothetical protein
MEGRVGFMTWNAQGMGAQKLKGRQYTREAAIGERNMEMVVTDMVKQGIGVCAIQELRQQEWVLQQMATVVKRKQGMEEWEFIVASSHEKSNEQRTLKGEYWREKVEGKWQ